MQMNYYVFLSLACLEYLPIFGQSALLCSNHNALVTINKPTNFCQAQGW